MVAYIYAGSLKQALAAAEVDFELIRTGTDTWKTDDDERVVYAYSAHALRGRDRGTKLYLAHGARERQDFRIIERLREMGRIEVVKEL